MFGCGAQVVHALLLLIGVILGGSFGALHGSRIGFLAGISWMALGGIGGLVAGHLLGLATRLLAAIPDAICHALYQRPKERLGGERRRRYFARLAAEKAGRARDGGPPAGPG